MMILFITVRPISQPPSQITSTPIYKAHPSCLVKSHCPNPPPYNRARQPVNLYPSRGRNGLREEDRPSPQSSSSVSEAGFEDALRAYGEGEREMFIRGIEGLERNSVEVFGL